MHQFDRIGTEIGDQEITVAVHCDAVGQGGAENVRRGITDIDPPMAGLRDELLSSIRADTHHAAARVGAPQSPVTFRQDALRTLQALSYGPDRVAVHGPAD